MRFNCPRQYCSNMARPTSGEAHVFGLASSGPEGVEIRRRTAFVSDDKDLYDYMCCCT